MLLFIWQDLTNTVPKFKIVSVVFNFPHNDIHSMVYHLPFTITISSEMISTEQDIESSSQRSEWRRFGVEHQTDHSEHISMVLVGDFSNF